MWGESTATRHTRNCASFVGQLVCGTPGFFQDMKRWMLRPFRKTNHSCVWNLQNNYFARGPDWDTYMEHLMYTALWRGGGGGSPTADHPPSYLFKTWGGGDGRGGLEGGGGDMGGWAWGVLPGGRRGGGGDNPLLAPCLPRHSYIRQCHFNKRKKR